MKAASREAKLRAFANGAKPAPKWTAQKQIDSEIERLSHAVVVASTAASVPRRLGGDATAEQLAADKKLAKSLAYRLRDALRLWRLLDGKGYEEPTLDPAAVRLGASVEWEAWSEKWIEDLRRRRAKVAATTLAKGNIDSGIRFVHLYTREISVVEDALARAST